MTYQVLARKWRPQDFSSLIGQQPIVTALRNALTEDRVGQAYIFSGIRGVGKTTAARLFAKALNCERGPAADPCNECSVCRDITAGADLDVIEVDAATYSKVEQVRELTDSLRYAPTRNPRKVVVVDEIHRLSRQAFDALLKIVEEPPPHLVFIFATTEIEAVPATLLSRCQEYHFRRVSPAEVGVLLRRVCDDEAIEASESTLRILARAGEGSVRDSLALLDQLATFGRGCVSPGDAARLVGGLDLEVLARLLGAILGGDGAAISSLVRELEDRGLDLRRAYAHFLAYCRDALHLAVGAEVDLSAEHGQPLLRLVRQAGYENLLRLTHHLLSSEAVVRRSESSALAIEVAWLRAAELPRLLRLESLLRGELAAPREEPPADAASPSPSPPPRPEVPAPAPRPTSERSDPLESLLTTISRRRQPLAAHLREARALRLVDRRLLIRIEAGDDWLQRALEKPANRRILQDALVEVLGQGARWELEERSAAAEQQPSDPARDEAVRDPTVQAVLDIFGGRVESVEHRNPPTEE